MYSRRTVVLGLAATVTMGPWAGLAQSDTGGAKDEAWLKTAAGDFAGAIRILDARLADVKLDREARFDRARLSYGIGNFESSRQDLQLLLKRPPGSSLGSVFNFVPEIRSVNAWTYFVDGRLGQVRELPASQPHDIEALLRHDVSRDAYIQNNIALIRSAIEFANERISSQATGETGVPLIRFGLPSGLSQGFAFVADFALAQQAFVKNDTASAKDFLMRAVDVQADNAIEFHVAKRQLSELT